MKEGTVSKHQIERFITAIEHRMEIKPLEQPEVAVKDLDSDTDKAHVVNLDRMDCTCPDFEYNCMEGQFCKHIYRTVLEKHKMLEGVK